MGLRITERRSVMDEVISGPILRVRHRDSLVLRTLRRTTRRINRNPVA
jgi:hypothetical protein